ncbi:Nucleic-acid-binding protein from transposon X-element [Eumeta japonica]|uniref:Nucleic-acid-binding protein from transposon X-element n=1 Tax=Eumeta variegata TaxID=151549 RepID=A0A4C1XWY9_EUMVA|nr:Nucleic-acid-binding protein from transposon X-element [Eumeta japonica]
MDKTPGTPGIGDPKRVLKFLPLAEANTSQAKANLNDVGSASSASSREQSPSPSVCSGKRTSRAISSDESSEQSVKGSDEEEQENLLFKGNGKPTECTDSPASPVSSFSQKSVVVHKQTTSETKSNSMEGNKPSPPPRSKPPPPPICLRDKSKWNMISSACTRLHINYTRAHNTNQGNRITAASIDDFRKLNTFFIKSDLPFHTYALEEERKVKAVLKGIPLEFETEDIKLDLERQGYPVLAVHRMHRRDGTALRMSLIILERWIEQKIFSKKLSNICGLSGIIVEVPYRRGKPGQCYRCQLYGHAAANCHAQPRCVKCLVLHWTKDCNRNREG